MASITAYSVGRLAKYVTESTFRNLRSNLYRSTTRGYSTEEKAAEETSDKLPATVEECHKHIETLSGELNAIKAQVKDYEDKYKRALAEGENVRRRMVKQVEDAKSFAIQSFCKDLLDVADTLSVAAETVPESALGEGGAEGAAAALRSLHDGVRLTRAMLTQVADTLSVAAETVPESALGEGGAEGAAAALRSLHDGVRLTRAMLTQVFTRHGLVAVSPLREKFDPNLHEALFQQEVEGAEPGTVVAVSKVGYKLHERCVRPALVGVAKGSS